MELGIVDSLATKRCVEHYQPEETVMSRINPIERDSANPEQAKLLDAIQQQRGMVPNFLKVFAN